MDIHLDKHAKKADAADKPAKKVDAAEIQRQIAEHEQAIIDLNAQLYVPVTFPKMVYKDLNDNGKFEDPGETRTVVDEADLKKALAEGWSDHPDKAVKASKVDYKS